jgi:hypothetical protein
VPWKAFEASYDVIRQRIEAVITGFENFNNRARQPDGFYLPNVVKQRKFNTASGKAESSINTLNPIQLEDDQKKPSSSRARLFVLNESVAYGMIGNAPGKIPTSTVAKTSAPSTTRSQLQSDPAVSVASSFESEK